MPNTSWNAADLVTTTLSGGNLTATSTGTTGYVRAVGTQPASGAGKFYWEVKPTTWVGTNTGIGFCSSIKASPSGASSIEECLVYKTGIIWINSVNTASTLGSRAANDVIGVALDLGAQLVWYRVAPAGNWNGSGTANPATGTGGLSTTSVSLLDSTPLMTWGASGDVSVSNFGDTAFTGTVPAGFTSGFPVGVPPTRVYTYWNPADRTGSVTLTNTNRTATTNTTNQGVRGLDGQTTGKYYFETTMTHYQSSSTAIGLANATALLTTGNNTGSVITDFGGTIYLNGSASGASLGGGADGDIIGIALDLTSNLVWLRVAPSGNWNGNAGFAPGGTGGLSVTALGTPIYPKAFLAANSAALTANFGNAAFSGAVPSGYTSGWTNPAADPAGASQAYVMVLA